LFIKIFEKSCDQKIVFELGESISNLLLPLINVNEISGLFLLKYLTIALIFFQNKFAEGLPPPPQVTNIFFIFLTFFLVLVLVTK